jgi:hypothetical protein
MIVARQFIAWNRSHERHRPVGYGMIVALVRWLTAFCATLFLAYLQTPTQHSMSGVTIPHTVPTGRGAFFVTSQAINCLATIIQPLRGNKPSASVHLFDSTSESWSSGPPPMRRCLSPIISHQSHLSSFPSSLCGFAALREISDS